MIRVNPKIDIVFRKLFGSEENKDILRAFINSILPEKEQIASLEIKNPYNLASYVRSKGNILDIKAQAADGRLFDVELQVGEQTFFGKRIKYYIDKMYVDQLEVSGLYSSLKKVIGVALLDFDYFSDTRHVRGITYKDIDTNETYDLINLSDIYFIELRKFKKELKDISTALDRWITFLNKAHEYDKDKIPPELSVDENVGNAIKKLDVMYLSKDEREIYEAEQKKRLDSLEEIMTAETKGREKGREEGEKLKAIEIATNLIAAGMTSEQIALITGLVPSELEKIVAEKPVK
ncbi:MAG: Rpn family recombination-promoting nuclease/putative transposase [Candidatus Riflebacteria bacterium]|nr:Rpn family recombination-promoting nuclease/putative transposase [Candidatus Riflebacteria bacterium]